MALPNFLICGTQKGGTTALYHYLREHPEIFMPKVKEVHFFDLNWQRGLKWYEGYFEGVKNAKAIGEASPFYMYLEEVPKRIYEVLPDVKLIFILREPVSRAYSHYWHEVRLGYESLTFEEAIKMEEERLSTKDIFYRQQYSYKDRGKYVTQLRRYRKYFSDEQMLILLKEELKKDPQKVMKEVFEFLGVNLEFKSPNWYTPHYIGESPRIWRLQQLKSKISSPLLKKLIDWINLKPGYPPINPQTKKSLNEYFKPYNNELERFLGKELTDWYK